MNTAAQNFILLLLVVSAILFSGCFIEPIKEDPPQYPDDSELIFHSGFEGSSAVFSTSNDQIEDIEGIDTTLFNRNDWVLDFDQHENIGAFRIYYEGGDESQRSARVVEDPQHPDNRVLSFWLSEPNVDWLNKGRIQADVYDNNNLFEIYQKVRIYLDPAFAELRDYPGRIWHMGMMTLWNDRGWFDSEYPFRITLGMEKPLRGVGEDLYFFARGRVSDNIPTSDADEHLWKEINEEVHIPFGEWFTMEMYFKEGDASTGRFYVAITREGGPKEVVFDIRNFTHHPNDPAPDGLTDFNPLKLYTSQDILDFMQRHDKALQIYWDDYELWKNREPEIPGFY